MRISSLTEDERFTILWFTALSPSLDLMPIYLLSKKLNLETLLIIKSMWSCCANERPAKWTANDNVESAAETLRRSIWQIHISPSSVYSGFRLCPEPRAAASAPHPIPYDEYLTYGAHLFCPAEYLLPTEPLAGLRALCPFANTFARHKPYTSNVV